MNQNFTNKIKNSEENISRHSFCDLQSQKYEETEKKKPQKFFWFSDLRWLRHIIQVEYLQHHE